MPGRIARVLDEFPDRFVVRKKFEIDQSSYLAVFSDLYDN